MQLDQLLAQPLPKNLEAEAAVLGAMFVDPDRFVDVEATLQPSHFFEPNHSLIWQAMRAVNGEGHRIDGLSVAEELKRRGQLLQVGGAPLIAELHDQVVTAANVAHFASMVREAAMQRGLHRIAVDLLREACLPSRPVTDTLSLTERQLGELSAQRSVRRPRQIRDVLFEVLAEIDKRSNDTEAATGSVLTGYRELDAILGGLKNGSVNLLAARPSLGKTALAIGISERAAWQGPVLFLTLEQSDRELVIRLLSARSGIDSQILQAGYIPDHDTRIVEGVEAIGGLRLWIVDCPGATVFEIASTCRRAAVQIKPVLVVIDYLQLITPEDRRGNRNEQVSTISSGLKNLARELDVPLLILSQLSRKVEERGGQPKLSDLRDSGSLEQDADVAMMLWRESRSDGPHQINLLIPKHRNGRIGNVPLWFTPERVEFTDMGGPR